MRNRERPKWGMGFLWAAPVLMLGLYFFLPFCRLQYENRNFTLSAWELLAADLNTGKGMIAPPVLTRALSLLIPASGLLSLVLLFRKKSLGYAAGMLSGCGIVLLLFGSLFFWKVGGGVAAGVLPLYGMAILLLVLLAGSFAGFACWDAERLSKTVFLLFSLAALLSLAAIVGFMLAMGVPAIAKIGLVNFLFSAKWSPTAGTPSYGIGAMVLTTLYATAGAALLAAPVGVLTAVFLAELAPRPLSRMVRPAIDLLAGIPSVIFGFFGMMAVVPFVRDVFHAPVGDGLLSVILILAMMILPTVISLSETSLRAVPRAYQEASLGLGATKMQTIFSVLLPAARSGISSGLILGIGRALGETMAVMMVAGNVVNLPGLFKTVRPMTAGIVLEMAYSEGLHRGALFGIGLVLLAFILCINLLFTFFLRRAEKRHEA